MTPFRAGPAKQCGESIRGEAGISFYPAMQLEERIIWIGRSLDRLARRLGDLGYQFHDPGEVFPGPAVDADASIARIEREIGEVPEAIKLFWRLVSSVNFIGTHALWDGGDCPDPIVVFPPVYAISELEDFLSNKDDRLAHNFPYLLPISPDPLHKQGVSGGMWYNLTVPAVAADPPLNDERHQTSFVGYLELAVRWGGFPGLDQSPHHIYPLDAIRDGLEGEG